MRHITALASVRSLPVYNLMINLLGCQQAGPGARRCLTRMQLITELTLQAENR